MSTLQATATRSPTLFNEYTFLVSTEIANGIDSGQSIGSRIATEEETGQSDAMCKRRNIAPF
jgi:hypothetical protein